MNLDLVIEALRREAFDVEQDLANGIITAPVHILDGTHQITHACPKIQTQPMNIVPSWIDGILHSWRPHNDTSDPALAASIRLGVEPEDVGVGAWKAPRPDDLEHDL